MKRAILILVAVLAVLLVYPATTPSAKSYRVDADSPNIITGPSGYEDPIDLSGNGDGDDGDSDGVSGIRGGRRDGFTNVSGQTGNVVTGGKLWWMYLFRIVLIR